MLLVLFPCWSVDHKTGGYRIGWLVLSTAAFTPAALGVLQAHAFIQSLGTEGILVGNMTDCYCPRQADTPPLFLVF